MLIKSILIRHFRCLLNETVAIDDLTALVGANGAGKSTLLRALEVFYAGSPRVGPEDYYAEDTSRSIEIELTFHQLSSQEKEQYSAYLEGDELTVARVFPPDSTGAGKFHGSRLQHPDLVRVRRAGNATQQKAAYNELRQQALFSDLPAWANQEAGLRAMSEWELSNPESCERIRDEGQFFGFTEVAQGYLGRSTRLVMVPAVREAADDASDTKTSPVGEIMELVVRSVLAQREELSTFKDELQKRFQELLAPENLPELEALESQLTSTLKAYAPDAAVALAWVPPGDIQVPMPKALVKLVEDGYGAPVAKTGHGLQRAFILTMLQQLAVLRTQAAAGNEAEEPGQKEQPTAATATAQADLLLGIEEPELYQHPNRQRHLARVLASLAAGSLPGVTRRIQVVYCTHSPLFLGIDRFDRIRLFRKVDAEAGQPKQSRVVVSRLDTVAEHLWHAKGSPAPKYTAATLRPRLAPLMTPWMNEGFFAAVVVLVEGESDKAVILGHAMAGGQDLERDGVAVIPCGGKDSLDRPYLVFSGFGIPAYLVWDNDAGGPDTQKATNSNRYLLRLLEEAEDDWPATVQTKYAALPGKLEKVLEDEIGNALFTELLERVKTEMGYAKRDDAMKNVGVVARVCQLAFERNRAAPTIEAIVTSITALRGGGANS